MAIQPLTAKRRMPLVPALETLVRLRGERIVVTTMGAAREWPKLGDHPLDLHYLPSAMGEAPALGLGLALARPEGEVLVVNGDGAMLMNLGSLVTIVASGAKNITVVVLDNGIYEVTGGQQIAATVARQRATLSYTGMALAAGFESSVEFNDLELWQRAAAAALELPGPRFISLAVEPVGANYHLESPGPLADRLDRFRQAIADRFI